MVAEDKNTGRSMTVDWKTEPTSKEIENIKRKVKKVDDLILQLKSHKNSYSFLIGAGTSAEAGIPVASEFINEWKMGKFEEVKGREPDDNNELAEWADEWEEKYKQTHNTSYGFWFQQCHPSPEERRKFIESKVKNITPTRGIISLAIMMSEGIISTCLTPNFDDLLYDAFYYFLGTKPLKINHDAIAPEYRITQDKSTIIKLHGDYLYRNLRNRGEDTEELKKSMKDAIKKTLSEFGLIVVGYGGRDDSIMSILHQNHPPLYGLWWGIRKEQNIENLPVPVLNLLKKADAYPFLIESSESFFSKLNEKLEIDEPPELIGEMENRYKERMSKLQSTSESALEDEKYNIMQLLQNDKDAEALEKMNDLYENHQNDTSALLFLGNRYADLKQFDEAEKIYSELIEQGDNKSVGYFNRGNVYLEREEFSKALENYNKSIEENPENFRAYNNRAFVYLQNQEYEKAIEECNKAIEINSEYSEPYFNKAQAYFGKKQYKKTIDIISKSLEFDSEPSKSFNLRGRANAKLGNYQKAIEDFTKALNAKGEYFTYLVNRSEAYICTVNFKEAKKDASNALQNAEEKYHKAVGKLLKLISMIALNEEHDLLEEEYREICEDEFDTNWDFETLDSWLEEANLNDPKIKKIKELLDLLRKHS